MQINDSSFHLAHTLFAITCLLGILAPTHAQEPTGAVGTLIGRVADSDGCPLPDIEISVIDASGRVIQAAKTDARGQFRMTNLTTGRATLRAEHIGFNASERIQVLYAGVNVWDTGLVLGLIAPSKPHKISGLIRDSKGGAIADATVTLSDVFTGAVKEQVRTDSRGRYAFQTSDTRQYVLVVTAPDYAPTSGTVSFKLATDPDAILHFRLASTPCTR